MARSGKKKKYTARRKFRIGDLPEAILIHILSMVGKYDSKQVVRSSVLSKQWRHLWKSVPLSLYFNIPNYYCSSSEEKTAKAVASITRELYYWRFCQKITKFKVNFYRFPNYITDDIMKKVLSGCPNLEMLELAECLLNRLEISSPKLRVVIIEASSIHDDDPSLCLEVFAPFVRDLHILKSCNRILLRNVASLLTARLHFEFFFAYEEMEKELICLNELLDNVAHVKLGPWCIQCLSILELKGWKFPPSSRKFLKLGAFVQWDSPGICSFLQSSLDLEMLVIDWYNYSAVSSGLLSRYTNEDEQSMRFERRNLNCPLLHLKTIKFFGSLRSNKFVLPMAKYLLKNAIALEKFIIVADSVKGSHDEYVIMEEQLLSFPRSSPLASVVFSCK